MITEDKLVRSKDIYIFLITENDMIMMRMTKEITNKVKLNIF